MMTRIRPSQNRQNRPSAECVNSDHQSDPQHERQIAEGERREDRNDSDAAHQRGHTKKCDNSMIMAMKMQATTMTPMMAISTRWISAAMRRRTG